MRLLALRAESEGKLRTILQSEEWKAGKERLLKLVRDYEECTVPAKKVFQFFIPASKRSGQG